MQTLIDILGSSLIGGIVVLMIIQLNMSINNSLTTQVLSKVNQAELSNIVLVLEEDIRNAGFRIPDSLKISRADSNRITIRLDMDNDGGMDSISYYRQVDGGVSFLYRVVNNQVANAARFPIATFRVWYYDANGNITTFRSRIKSFRILMTVVSSIPEPERDQAGNFIFTAVHWEKLFNPINL